MKLPFCLLFLTLLAYPIQSRDSWDPIDFSHVFRPHLPVKSRERSSRIIGGNEAKPHAHPYQVACLSTVSTDGAISMCGGSIINQRTVLTAAHCISLVRFHTIVVAGAHNVQKIENSQQRIRVPSTNYRIHPRWNTNTIHNDIATMILPSSLTFNSYVQPARLPTGLRNDLFVGETARVVGWGRVSPTESSSPVLREAFYRIITNAECKVVHGLRIIDSSICGGFIGRGASCNQDSGGSFTVPRPGSNIPVLIGVVSFGDQPCGKGTPTAFARVTSFLNWIAENSG